MKRRLAIAALLIGAVALVVSGLSMAAGARTQASAESALEPLGKIDEAELNAWGANPRARTVPCTTQPVHSSSTRVVLRTISDYELIAEARCLHAKGYLDRSTLISVTKRLRAKPRLQPAPFFPVAYQIVPRASAIAVLVALALAEAVGIATLVRWSRAQTRS